MDYSLLIGVKRERFRVLKNSSSSPTSANSGGGGGVGRQSTTVRMSTLEDVNPSLSPSEQFLPVVISSVPPKPPQPSVVDGGHSPDGEEDNNGEDGGELPWRLHSTDGNGDPLMRDSDGGMRAKFVEG
jgi:hypothetical protein